MADPWFKFFPSDWRQDPALRMCGLSARGLWVEMISLMHQSTPYGHLLVSGQSPTDAQLAMLVGCPTEQIPVLIGELESAGVFSRTRSGVIYSRKMSRMQKKAAIARKNGLSGGNPTLSKEREIQPLDNLKIKPEVKPQKLEPEPEEVKREAKASPKKQSRKCKLPDGWVPSERNIQDAEAKQFSAKEIQDEADKFSDHHRAKGTTFADWDAGWRTWLGNARKFGAGRSMAFPASPSGRGQGGSIASIVARRHAGS